MLPPYRYVAHLNGWGRRLKIHRWGVQFGSLSVIWWDLWSRRPCWEVSRVRASAAGEETCHGR